MPLSWSTESVGDLYRTLRKHPVIDLVITVAVAIGIAFLVQLWIVKPFQIPSGSMIDTFDLGDRIIAAGEPGRDPEAHRIRIFSIKRPVDGWEWQGVVE